ncbi:hypothetical protein RI367_005417 [Sorochytrium milnesiophthora]
MIIVEYSTGLTVSAILSFVTFFVHLWNLISARPRKKAASTGQWLAVIHASNAISGMLATILTAAFILSQFSATTYTAFIAPQLDQLSYNFILLQLLFHALSVSQRSYVVSHQRMGDSLTLDHILHHRRREVALMLLYAVVMIVLNCNYYNVVSVYVGCGWFLGIILYELFVSLTTFGKVHNMLQTGQKTLTWFWSALLPPQHRRTPGASTDDVAQTTTRATTRILRSYVLLMISATCSLIVFAIANLTGLPTAPWLIMTRIAWLLCALWNRGDILYLRAIVQVVHDNTAARMPKTRSSNNSLALTLPSKSKSTSRVLAHGAVVPEAS